MFRAGHSAPSEFWGWRTPGAGWRHARFDEQAGGHVQRSRSDRWSTGPPS